MEIRYYFDLLRRWAWLLLLGIVLGGGLAFAASRLTTPVYSATTTLLVSESKNSATPDYTGLLTSERLAKTYSELIKKRPVLEEVIKNLQLSLSVQALAASVIVQPVRDTLLIQVSVENTNAQLAARIAAELTKVFIEKNTDLQSSRFEASRQNLADELSSLDKEIKSAQASLEAVKASATPGLESDRARLETSLSELRRSYASLLQSYEQIRVAEAQTVNNVFVVDPPEAPRGAVRPNTSFNTIAGLVIGLLLAIALALLIEYLDDTVKTPDDVQQILGLTALGTVLRQTNPERNKMLITATQPKSSFSESFRTLRTNIQFSSVDKPIHSILVTSAGPGEGKSTLAANLAVAMAQAGHHTVLVDADLRRPSLHRLFDITDQAGLTNGLVTDSVVALNGNLHVSPIENLRILTSGPRPPNPAELLGSKRMHNLLEALKQESDMIIIDSPPALAVADASILASKVDGVILVVESGATRRGLAQKAKAQLEQVGAHMLGVAVNKLSARSAGEYYYYYYYNYYYYSSDEKSPDGERKVIRRKSSHSEKTLRARVKRLIARFRTTT
ncbi:MAG: polysaccharide biosynthesis tyrosine autokinase [Chloroflexi bacterium]|nr:polysaccharide biosynthesis tyrosine autokinase [Chloroflexota bacterium]